MKILLLPFTYCGGKYFFNPRFDAKAGDEYLDDGCEAPRLFELIGSDFRPLPLPLMKSTSILVNFITWFGPQPDSVE